MPGLSAGMNIGLSGLSAAQAALDVVGHNIANVNTPGYSREIAQLNQNAGQTFGDLTYGTGVDLTGIQSVRNVLLEQQITKSTSQQAGAETRYTSLSAVAPVFQDDGTTGLATQLNNFFSSVQKMAAQPEDTSLRASVVATAQNFLSNLKSDYQALQGAQGSADQQVVALVPQINTLTKQIAALNDRLGGETNSAQDGNALDQRQTLATQLGQLVGVQTYIDSKNQMNIALDNGGTPLVAGGTAYTMNAVPSATAPGYSSIQISLGNNAGLDVTSKITNGELGAQLDLRDNLLPGYQKQLDQLGAGLAYNVNQLQSNGYGMDGTQPVPPLDFFVSGSDPTGATGMTNHLPSSVQVPPDAGLQVPADDYKGTVMALTVNARIVADPSLIAAAAVAGQTGDNTQATAMAALQGQANTVDATGTGPGAASSGTLNNFINGLFTKAGTDIQGWKATATNQENITTALQTQRDNTSKVDLDTEASNLMTFQKGYQASARFVSVISSLMDGLINNLGR